MRTTRAVKDVFTAEVQGLKGNLEPIFGKDGPGAIIDIGACDGLSAIGYAKMYPKSRVWAVEARQDNWKEMVENIKAYGLGDRVEPIQSALGEASGMVQFFQSYGQAPAVKDWDTGNKSSSIFPPLHHLTVHPWCKFKPSKCYMMRLDDLLQAPYNVHHFDFIHIDVQGAELQVFRGGKEALRLCSAIWCEVSNMEFYKGQAMKSDVVSFLCKYGFYVAKDTCGDGKTGDCLFVRK